MIRTFKSRAAYLKDAARIIFTSSLFWAQVAALGLAVVVIWMLPTQPVAIFMNAMITGIAVAMVLTHINVFVEFYEPRNSDPPHELIKRTFAHWYSWSWWIFWFFVMLSRAYSYAFNYYDRPREWTELPLFNTILLLLIVAAAVQISIPFLVRENDELVTIRASNLMSGKIAHAAIIAGTICIGIMLFLS